ncbi:MAG: DUF3618 domain-containing protein [Solirubrobacterales bacterium]|nr:DUF3618 domain-containing protein [Solirubrobacterales bacterium]
MGQDPGQPGARVAGGEQRAAGEGARSPEQIRAEIEQTREELGDTVAALAEKTDVRAQAQRAAQNARATTAAKLDELKRSVTSSRDDLGTSARNAAPGSAGEAGRRLAGLARRYRVGLLVVGALVVGIVVGRARS